MALHPDFPASPYAILDPSVRWPADENEALDLLPPLVAQLRLRVKEFRDSGYTGARETSKSLLRWWFETEHHIPQPDGSTDQFRYYFAQREAIETIIYLVDVAGVRDKHDLMRYDATGRVSGNMFDEEWRRFMIKMATGSGKTKVMSLALAWSYFHKLYEPDSTLARNFLVIAPNIIVLDRLARDFEGLRIFYQDPVLPSNGYDGHNWQDDFQLTLHRQDEVAAATPVGNIFLTNIHRVYDSSARPPSAEDANTLNYFLGNRPTGETTDSQVELDALVRDIDELMVINDEAHHVHDSKLAWFRSIADIHNRLVQKDSVLSLQLDVSATPKHENGAIFAQTVVDYPLVEAIAQDIVKHPVVPDSTSQARLNERVTERFTEKYADFLNLGVAEWRIASQQHSRLDKKSILFVMVDDTRNCDEVAEYLRRLPDFEGEEAVLTIHTKRNGEISEASSGRAEAELRRLRGLANSIDDADSPYMAIVSVLMLKEGWDVRNVTTIVGLRAFTATSNILPEQTLGRGLRRMYPEEAGDVEESVSVIGTPAFMEFVESIQEEGVVLERAPMGDGDDGRDGPLFIEVDWENEGKSIDELDIEVPVLSARNYRNYQDLRSLDVSSLLAEPLTLRFFTGEDIREIAFQYTVVREDGPDYHHTTLLDENGEVDYRGVLGYFARTIMQELRLVGGYDILYAKVQEFVTHHLFPETVDLTDPNVIRNLSDIETTGIIIDAFENAINTLTVHDRGAGEIQGSIRLQDTPPFRVKNQGYTRPQKSVFNMIVGDSGLELQFADFLEGCSDVTSYAKNYMQARFKLDYLSSEGRIANYYPDFFVRTTDGKLFIVETKGMPDPNEAQKMARLRQWCEDVAATDWPTQLGFVYVDQTGFEQRRAQLRSFRQIISLFTDYQTPD